MITTNAMKVLEKRYFAENEDWEGLCTRVSQKVAEAETEADRGKWAKKFKEMMYSLNFLPNSPTLRNFGRNNGSGSACFVLPIDDSRRSIFKTLSDAVDVQAYGGGTGFSFSSLRPKGDKINSTEGHASGPISFMRIYDFTIGDIIKQGGTRNGANMAVLRVDHPDIEEFIFSKRDEGTIKNFNISVGITESFMEAVENDKTYDLVFNGNVYKTLPARKIWGKIVDGAWQNGEPGVLFLDTINRKNPLKMIGSIEATNPCGEQPLLPYHSCNLGSINLSQMVKGDWLKGEAEVDWEKLDDTTHTATRFLDNVITVNPYPVPEIEYASKRTRQIGLGIMGFADLCIKLHVRYGSGESIDLAGKIMFHIYENANAASQSLGKEKGFAPFYEEFQIKENRRNGTLTTIAPTGTLSVIANCSSGCEPYFSFNYTKECLGGEKLDMVPKVVQEWLAVNGGKDGLPEFFIESSRVSIEEHILVQAAFQRGVDSGVSKTINAVNDTPREDVSKAFFLAWEKGCKGITFYRSGSRDEEALYESKKPAPVKLERGKLKNRPRATTGPSIKIKSACGKLYVDPHFDSEDLQEVFIRTEGGGCEANTKALGVLLSYCLRAGVSKEKIIKSMKSIHCPACTRAISSGKDVEINSCAAGMGKALEYCLQSRAVHCQAAREIEDAESYFSKKAVSKQQALINADICPDCGDVIYRAEGCLRCPNPECGWTKC